MAVLDDLVQFVSANTVDGSWQKPQLRQRCEEFLEDGRIVAPTGTISITENGTVDVTQYASASVEVSGGGTPDRITAGMIEDMTWPELTFSQDGDIMFIAEDVINEIVGTEESGSYKNCSFMIIADGSLYQVVSYATNVSYQYDATDSDTYIIDIDYQASVQIEVSGGRLMFIYNAERGAYVYSNIE